VELPAVEILLAEQNVLDCEAYRLHICSLAVSRHVSVDRSNCCMCLIHRSKVQTYDFARV
jgi:hypothetical protein